MIDKGVILDVVLDAVFVERDGREFVRVMMRGVFPPGTDEPDLAPGARRNVVKVFFGVPISPSPIGVFLIETGIEQEVADEPGAEVQT